MIFLLSSTWGEMKEERFMRDDPNILLRVSQFFTIPLVYCRSHSINSCFKVSLNSNYFSQNAARIAMRSQTRIFILSEQVWQFIQKR
jgi:hypothetical protein